MFRLYEANGVDEIADRLRRVGDDPRSADVAQQGMGHLRTLFATPRSPGIELAVTALGGITDQRDVTETMVGYTRELLSSFGT